MTDPRFVILKADTDPDEPTRWHLFRMTGDFIDTKKDEVCRGEDSQAIREIQEFMKMREQCKSRDKPI